VSLVELGSLDYGVAQSIKRSVVSKGSVDGVIVNYKC
jgi:hypothetical protein